MAWWGIDREALLIKRNGAKLKFLREHYGDGVRGKDLAGCPLATNAVKECMEREKIGAKRTIAIFKELEPFNAKYLLAYSSVGVSLQSIAPVDFEHEPTLDEAETFNALVHKKGMKPDMAFNRIVNVDEETLRQLKDDACKTLWLDAEEQSSPRMSI